jgi:hypothetical protein
MKKHSPHWVRFSIGIDGQSARLASAVADFVILNLAFFLLYFLRLGHFRISAAYFGLLLFFNILWLTISLTTRRLRLEVLGTRDFVLLQFKSILILLYSVSFLVVFLGLKSFSRLHIFGTCLVMLLLELAFFSVIRLGGRGSRVQPPNRSPDDRSLRAPLSASLFIFDFILLNIAFWAVNVILRGRFVLPPQYDKFILLVYGLWLLGSLLTRKFAIQNFHNIHYALAAGVKSIVFIALSLATIIFALRLDQISCAHVLGMLLLFWFLESGLIYFFFVTKLGKDIDDDIESLANRDDFLGQKDLPPEGLQKRLYPAEQSSFMKTLNERYLKASGIYEFVNRAIDLAQIENPEMAIINSPELIDLVIIDDEAKRLVINFHPVNDIRWINRYFLEIHQRLITGGYFVGRVKTIEIHKMEFFDKYPRYFAEALYVLHFLFFRVFPKLPKLRKIYFSLTKGKNRMISRAEVLGRLSFCGFQILAEREIGGTLFFVAQKKKSPSLDRNPSYGPLIRLKRVGWNGQIIEVLKFRTMYPYSEYLQEYIYQHQNLEEGGKIHRDFRVTDWGGFLRRYWLDELPMLYNWFKGDIKLFGVRPLSWHYLSLYDGYVQKLRKKVKPGLIPPYYADMPRRIEEISASEKKYISSYMEHPIKTQILYFIKVMNNIFFRGARSG